MRPCVCTGMRWVQISGCTRSFSIPTAQHSLTCQEYWSNGASDTSNLSTLQSLSNSKHTTKLNFYCHSRLYGHEISECAVFSKQHKFFTCSEMLGNSGRPVTVDKYVCFIMFCGSLKNTVKYRTSSKFRGMWWYFGKSTGRPVHSAIKILKGCVGLLKKYQTASNFWKKWDFCGKVPDIL